MGSAKEDAAAPHLVGNYRLLGELGRDVLGVLHLACPASAREFPKWAVVRRVHPGVARDNALVQAFLAATRVALRVVHPNVAATFDCGPRDKPPWVAREHIAGETVLEVIQYGIDTERVPWELAAHIVAQAALGLEGIRMRMPTGGPAIGFITGAAPPYVMLSFSGEVKIVDGCMPLIDGRPMIDSAALPYLPTGLAGEPLEDMRPHVFGLGVMLWELTAGRRLFRGDTDDETLRLVEARVVPYLRNIAPAAAPLDDIVRRALGKSSADAFETVTELEHALVECMQVNGKDVGRDDVSRFMRGAFGRRVTEQKAALDDAWAVAQVMEETAEHPEWAPIDIDTSVSARFNRPEETALTHLAPRRGPSIPPPPPSPPPTVTQPLPLPTVPMMPPAAGLPLPPPPRAFEDATTLERQSPVQTSASVASWRTPEPYPTLPDIPDEIPTGEVTAVRPTPPSYPPTPMPAMSAPRIDYLPEIDEPDTMGSDDDDETVAVVQAPPPWPPIATPRTVASNLTFPTPVPAPQFPSAERDPYFTAHAPPAFATQEDYEPETYAQPPAYRTLPLPTPPPARAYSAPPPVAAWSLGTPAPLSPRIGRPLPVVPLHSQATQRPPPIHTERTAARNERKSLWKVGVVAFLGSLVAVKLISSYVEPEQVTVHPPPPPPPTHTTPARAVPTTPPRPAAARPDPPAAATSGTIPVATLDDLPRASPQPPVVPDTLPRGVAPPQATPQVLPRSVPAATPNDLPRAPAPTPPAPRPAAPYVPPAPAAGRSTGLLSVFCTPACDRVLDGSRSLGPSPVFKATVSAGVHHLRLKIDSPAAEKDVTVTVPENDTTVVREAVGQ